jgi:hypothetical protein
MTLDLLVSGIAHPIPKFQWSPQDAPSPPGTVRWISLEEPSTVSRL